MVVLKFINKIWRRDDSKKTGKSKDEQVRKITKQAIKKYEKTLRRLAYE
ncbi:MAG TPA: hypothetical protein PLS49_02580 [Candidatus Woesebacteria bacterium]|nr:hypothetical protein [Candidatus Woesebacteria bacterium]